MSWQQSRPDNVATTAFLEERINMYISAMDTASAVNDSHQSLQLQRDIQKLVDLMERVGAGEEIMESQVPPPLAITPQIDVLPNALGELSARLAEYHKALYFAEEELSEERANKIQGMQHALQAIHNLQKRAEAGFPIRADEVPPPISIPSDDEFDNDAVNTISRRLAQYQEALKTAEQLEGTDRRRITKIQSTLRTLEFLMTRAKSKRPVWKKDIPPEFEYCNVSPKGSPTMNKTKYLLVIRSLILRLSAPKILDSDVAVTAAAAHKKLKTLEEELVNRKDSQPWLHPGNSLPELTKEVENLEKLAAKKKENKPDTSQDLLLLETRIREYTAAALKAKKDNEISMSIKHIKVLKGLQALKKSLEKGEAVDMTLVPPAPKDFTPTNEAPPPVPQPNEAPVTVAVSRSSQDETARVPPVNSQSSQETEKDKLAQRLTNYLDCGDDKVLETSGAEASESTTAVDSKATKSTAKLLKKVQNARVKLPAEKVLYGDPGYSDASMKEEEADHPKEDVKETKMDVVQSLSNSEKEKHQVGVEEDEKEARIEEDNAANVNTTVQEVQETAALSENSTEGSDKSQESNQKEEKPSEAEPEKTNEKPETAETSPKSSPKSSGDIYSRKTLDSVGFLSCQIVPENKGKKTQEISNNTMNEQIGNQDLKGANDSENPVSLNIEQLNKNSELMVPESSSGNQRERDSLISARKLESEEAKLSEHQGNDASISENQSQFEQETVSGSQVAATTDKVVRVNSHSFENEKSAQELSAPGNFLSNGSGSSISLTSSQDVPSSNLSQAMNASPQTNDTLENQTASSQTNHPNSGNVAGVENATSAEHPQQHTIDVLTAHPNIAAAAAAKTIPASCSSDDLEFQDLMASMSASPVSSTKRTSDKTNGSAYNISGELNNQVASESVSSSVPPVRQKEESLNNKYQGLSNGFEMNGSHTRSNGSSSLNTHTTNGHVFPSSQSINGHPNSLPHTDYSSEQGFMSLPANSSTMVGSFSGRSLPSNAAKFNGSHTNVVFTCLENLKYDLMVETSKNQSGRSEEVTKIEQRMDQIKAKLRHSGRLIWELYKTCVESELTSITKELHALHGLSQDERLITLQHKQNIAKRELKLLQERLPNLSY